jgi:hypothetical protein
MAQDPHGVDFSCLLHDLGAGGVQLNACFIEREINKQ